MNCDKPSHHTRFPASIAFRREDQLRHVWHQIPPQATLKITPRMIRHAIPGGLTFDEVFLLPARSKTFLGKAPIGLY